MKNKLNKLLLSVCVALSLTSVSGVADAAHCRWVNGYWYHGYYHRGYKVCRSHHPRCFWRNGRQFCR